VCTENPIRIDWGRESPNVSAMSAIGPKQTFQPNSNVCVQG